MRQVSDELLAQLKAKNARARKLEINILEDKIEIVVRPASRAEWRGYKTLNNSGDDNKINQAREQLLRFCVMDPDPKLPELDLILDQYPAFADTAFVHLAKMAGVSAETKLGE